MKSPLKGNLNPTPQDAELVLSQSLVPNKKCFKQDLQETNKEGECLISWDTEQPAKYEVATLGSKYESY